MGFFVGITLRALLQSLLGSMSFWSIDRSSHHECIVLESLRALRRRSALHGSRTQEHESEYQMIYHITIISVRMGISICILITSIQEYETDDKRHPRLYCDVAKHQGGEPRRRRPPPGWRLGPGGRALPGGSSPAAEIAGLLRFGAPNRR